MPFIKPEVLRDGGSEFSRLWEEYLAAADVWEATRTPDRELSPEEAAALGRLTNIMHQLNPEPQDPSP